VVCSFWPAWCWGSFYCGAELTGVEATPAINLFNVRSIDLPPPSLPRPRKGDPPKMAVPPLESLRNNDEVMSVSRLPTDELVAILYRRMQNVESGDGDRPPDYPASETGH
jgi:hypothetical protein